MEQIKLLNQFNQTPPIIIMGCHRSGTSILTELLEINNIFIGADTVAHNESQSFFKANELILNQFGSTWANVDNTIEMLEKPFIPLQRHIEFLIQSNAFQKEFVGPSIKNVKRKILRRNIWGWKDPRNTITLPLWLSIFPDAKVLHIYRHGFDVANSIYKREIKRSEKDYLHASFLCEIEGAFELWKTYESNAIRLLSNLEEHRKLSIPFELFVNDTNTAIHKLSDFIGKQMSCGNNFFDNTKAYRYRDNFSLFKPIHQELNNPIFKKLGYIN